MNTKIIRTAWHKVAVSTIPLAIYVAMVSLPSFGDIRIVTNTLDGVSCYPVSSVKWQIKLDSDTHTVQLGLDTGNAPGGSYYKNGALGYDPQSKVTVPQYFTVEGDDEKYLVTKIHNRAFVDDNNLHDVTVIGPFVFGDSDAENYSFGYRSFHTPGLEHLFIKGPITVASGETQEYQLFGFDINGTGFWPFSNTSKLKLVIVGPNSKTGGSRARFKFNDSGATVFLPDRIGNTSWRNSGVCESSKDKVVWYGPNYDFDMTMSETAMTFAPKNEAGLTNVLAWASTIKTAFDMDVIVNITNRIEMSESVEITEAMIQNVTLEAPPWYLTFAVKSQEQLNNVLGAVSVDTPIIIDIDGVGKNQITIPEGRKVAILAKSGWTFGKKLNGLIITFY